MLVLFFHYLFFCLCFFFLRFIGGVGHYSIPTGSFTTQTPGSSGDLSIYSASHQYVLPNGTQIQVIPPQQQQQQQPQSQSQQQTTQMQQGMNFFFLPLFSFVNILSHLPEEKHASGLIFFFFFVCFFYNNRYNFSKTSINRFNNSSKYNENSIKWCNS